MVSLAAFMSVFASAVAASQCAGSCDDQTAMMQLKPRTSLAQLDGKEPLLSLLSSFLQEPAAVAKRLVEAPQAVQEALIKRANPPTEPEQRELLQRLLALSPGQRLELLELARLDPQVAKVYGALTPHAREQLVQFASSGSLDKALAAKASAPGKRPWWDLAGKIADLVKPTPAIFKDTPSGISGAKESPITGDKHQYMSLLEEEVNQLIGARRREGFACPSHVYPPQSETVEKFHEEMELSWMDCRLWWASKLHSEDMAKWQYFDHATLGTDEPFEKRVPRVAWNMVAQNEVIAGITVNSTDAESIVEAMIQSSDAHCRALGAERNGLVGAAYVNCSTTESDAVSPDNGACQFGSYWTVLFSYTKDSVHQSEKLAVKDQGVDRSCYVKDFFARKPWEAITPGDAQ